MSINMDNGGTEYADHEVQVVTNQMIIDAEDNGNDNATLLDQIDPVSNRGIDSDELAELVAMNRVARVQVESSDGQSQFNGAGAEASLGINLQESEIPSNASVNSPTSESRELIETPDNLQTAVGANYNEPGTLDDVQMAITGGFESGGTVGGSGSGGQTHERYINFRDEFGTGPFIDRTDDLTVFLEANPINSVSRVIVESTYTLYWKVEEMPEGRASFSRP